MQDKTQAPVVWKIEAARAVVAKETVPDALQEAAASPDALRAFLEAAAGKHGLRYLLAFADDGVIWGRIDKKQDSSDTFTLVTAPQVSPPLLPRTLQSARLFGETAELLLWRVEEEDGAFAARLLRDLPEGEAAAAPPAAAPLYTESLDENLYLWGSHAETTGDGFTVWREGAQGLRHAVPFVDAAAAARPPRLRVRHYLAPEEPLARIAVSRLVGLYADTEK